MKFKIEFDSDQKKFAYEDSSIYFKEDLENAVDKFFKMIDAPSKNTLSSSSIFNSNQYTVLTGGGSMNSTHSYTTGNIQALSPIQIVDLFSDNVTTWEHIAEVQPGDSITLEDMIK